MGPLLGVTAVCMHVHDGDHRYIFLHLSLFPSIFIM